MRRAWWSERWSARAGDLTCILVAVTLGGLASDATDVATSSVAGLNEALGLVAVVALWWRRRAPLTVAMIAFVSGAVAPLATGAGIVSLFSVAEQRPGRIPPLVLVTYVAAAVVGTALFPDEALGVLGSLLIGMAMTAAALGWGFAARARRELLASLADRAERAEREQHARVAEARASERNRIAAEMHDALAHRLSLLALHAGAIEHRPESPVEELVRSAAVVRTNAHLALEELRSVVGLLREDVASAVPLPTAGDIAALVQECEGAGMVVELVDDALDPAVVPADLGRHLYRIVQEGLTNARKHAPGRAVRVVLDGGPGAGIALDITNPEPVTAVAPVPGSGMGLVGVRERVDLLGGTLEAGPDASGGHRLRAWLPWPA